MPLPNEFCERMKLILKDKYDLFEQEFYGKIYRALRANTLKTEIELLKSVFELDKPTDFCKDSFYLPDNIQKIGNHLLHHAGAFYMQEPSASAVVEAIGIEKGDYVLDLCASPGGKTTQAAAKLDGEGFILSNEYVVSRVQPLVSNIERMGIVNSLVTSAHPEVLCAQLPLFFDKVIVDAPCSGEGMFRKESAAIENWNIENVKACAERQKKILQSASACVKHGGKMVYSTCTYSYEENEQVVEHFLANNRDFKLVEPCVSFGEDALSEFAPKTDNIYFARRIFNFNGGEGHFVAVFQRDGELTDSCCSLGIKTDKIHESVLSIFNEFFSENFIGQPPDDLYIKDDKVYITSFMLDLKNVKTARAGIFAGTIRGNRFVPEHALFNNTKFNPKNIVNFDLQNINANKFIHGEEIPCDTSLKGYVQVRVCNIPLGFGKASNGVLKNHYPKGLRTL